MALNLRHQTPAQFAARFWERARDADRVEFSRLMYWLTRRLVAGDLTDLQARNSFNTAFGRSLTAQQWTTLRASRITPAHDRYAAILAEGEL
jgi:hypothetical protein